MEDPAGHRNSPNVSGRTTSSDGTSIPNVATSPATLQQSNSYTKSHAFESGNPAAIKEEDNLSSDSVTQSSSDIPVPPDGGWGWLVVFASFMIHVVADGITYSFGIFVVELVKVFESGRGTVSFIPSILVGVTLGSGPIASSMTNRYGCRTVTILGAVVASIGLAASAAASSIAMLCVSIGLCTGLGFGLIYLPAIVSVSMYFEKRRAFATGVAVCGSGLGTFIMAPITEGLIGKFGWQGAFLVISVVVLANNILFGALFRPLPGSNASAYSTCSSPAEVGNEADESCHGKTSSSVVVPVSSNVSFASGDNSINIAPEIKINGEPFRPIALQMKGAGNTGNCDGKYSEMARMALSHPVLPSQPETKKPSVQYGSHSHIYEKRRAGAFQPSPTGYTNHPNAGVMFRKDILYGGSLYNIPEYKNNPRRYSRHLVALQDDQRRSVSNTAAAANGSSDESMKICCCIAPSSEATKAFAEMMDLSLLKDGVFMMFAVSNFMTSIGFNVPYVYTVDRAKLLDIATDDASFLLSVIGIANMLGRIVLGYISDRSWIDRLYLYNGCLAVCGIAMGLSNFCNDYKSQAIFCAVFGVTSGAYVGLTSVVLVDLLGLDKLTNAFGLLLLFQGIASVIGPPIIGWLYDARKSYELGFYFAGTMIFMSGIMLFGLPWIRPASKSRANCRSFELQGSSAEVEAFRPKNKIEEEDEEGWDDAPPMTMSVQVSDETNPSLS